MKNYKQVEKLLLAIDIDARLKDEDMVSFDQLRDFLEDNGHFNVEIIYYARAIEYLRENDSSLNESLEIASEMGYEVSTLDSEILASLLASQNVRQDFEDLESEIVGLMED